MADGIALREYRASDLDAIFRLDVMCFAEAFRFDRAAMRRFAQRKRAIALIAEGQDGEIRGFVIIHLEWDGNDRLGYVITLDIAPAFRREGLAARLMLEAEHRAKEQGARRMSLHVYAENEGAMRFYERMGYERVGEELGFYGKAGLNALVYSKSLGREGAERA